ncbi:MAG TPA: hypothetical protein VH092_29670 [Urbifossiella sp.]|jgi:DNA-directed RNA polymerase specialized sigma24 family protein|nr:hypothetical protein [Urbifossiella sp.]
MALRSLPSLASWLHGIARRVALKARARRGTERAREAAVAVPDVAPSADPTWVEVRAVLDDELARLPVRLRS